MLEMFWKLLQNHHVLLTFGKVRNPLRTPRKKPHPHFQKLVRDRHFFTLFTSKCASRHNAVHFFDILTSKSAPSMVCFVNFTLET